MPSECEDSYLERSQEPNLSCCLFLFRKARPTSKSLIQLDECAYPLSMMPLTYCRDFNTVVEFKVGYRHG